MTETIEFVEPLTKVERELMKELSIKAFGKSSSWHSILKKGFYNKESGVSSDHKPISYKKWYPLTVQQIKTRMEEIILEKSRVQNQTQDKTE